MTLGTRSGSSAFPATVRWVRHDVGRRGLRLIALMAFTAVGGAALVTMTAGVRRSDSVVDRIVSVVRPATAIVVPNQPGFDWSPVADLPMVDDLVEFPVLHFDVEGWDGEVGGFPPGRADVTEEWERPVVVEGRLADQARADEVTISPDIAAAHDVGVGDRLTIRLIDMGEALAGRIDTAERREVDVTVVGVAKLSFFSWEVQPTHAFLEAHRDLIVGDAGYVNALVRLERGSDDVVAFEGALAEIAGRPIEVLTNSETERQYRRAITLETGALALLAAATAVMVVLLVGPAAARLVSSSAPDAATLGQLGADRRTVVASLAGAPAIAILVGAVVSPAIAHVASDLFPIGFGRTVEPQPGRRVDWVAIGIGVSATAAILMGVVVFSAVKTAQRADEHVSAVLPGWIDRLTWRLPGSLPSRLGGRLALGHRPRDSAARAVTGIAAVGVAGFVAAFTFAAGLDEAIEDPSLFGQVFDAAAFVEPGTFDTDGIREAADVDAIAILRNVVADLEGRPVSTMSVEALVGEVDVAVRRGRIPAGPDEIALAPETFDELDIAIGDTVSLEGRQVEVVGDVLIPEGGHTSYTSGALLHPAATGQLLDDGLETKFEFVAVDFPEGTDVADGIDALDDPLRSMVEPWPPTGRQLALGSTDDLPTLFGCFVGAMTVAALLHALTTTERRRRHEVAVMQVIGLTRTQARRTVAWHAFVGAVCGTALGIPVGVLIGRTTWEAVARSLPAFERTPTAWWSVAAAVPLAVVVAIALATWPMARTARREPALILRTE
jgi:ABC-type lipoprotein release transport system permease subunit